MLKSGLWLSVALMVFQLLWPCAAFPEVAWPPQEARALWVVRTSLLSKESIDRMVDKASSGGFNTLFVQVCGRGDSYFPSQIYPPAENCRVLLETGFDPLAYVLERAHAKKIAVHAWVNTLLVWSSGKRPADRKHLLNRHPEWMMVDSDGVSMAEYPHSKFKKLGITGIFLSPACIQASRLVEEFILDLAARYPIDGIHLDYFRYPNRKMDFSAAAREEFKSLTGVDPVDLIKAPAAVKRGRTEQEYRELLEQWTAMRAELITRFLARLAGHLDEIKPQLVRSVAVKPDVESAYETFGQDWPTWVKDGLLDMVVPMAYSTKPEVVRSQISNACRLVGSSHVWAGLRAYNVPVSGVIERVKSVRDLNPGGYSFFSYDGMKNNRLFFESVKKIMFAR